ncbi:hypothetical protein [Nocardia testacea]|uniref:hypothetical protein n=1 Tax=Nocardia testacea TaxID=248551 RepID=UPI0012F6CCDF|nr:hypothetical protein [Nocardia testacea]
MNGDQRAVVNAILHDVQFADTLTAAEVDRTSSSLLHNPLWSLTPEQEYQSIVDALESGSEIGSIVGPRHSEDAVRNFLRQVVDRLDALRPWPDLPFQELPETRWSEFSGAPAIARVDVSWPEIETRVGRIFTESVPDSRQYLLLRLRSGIEVGFVWPGENEDSTAIVAPDASVPEADIVQEIVDATDLDSPEVGVLGGTAQ